MSDPSVRVRRTRIKRPIASDCADDGDITNADNLAFFFFFLGDIWWLDNSKHCQLDVLAFTNLIWFSE